MLRHSVDRTMGLLRKELEIRKHELLEQLHFCSLEKIFIEERIYKDKKFEQAPTMDAACEHIDDRLTPYYPQMIREVSKDDILKLMDIKMARILKFNSDKADELILRLKDEIADIDDKLAHMVRVTIKWFQYLKDKYGADHPRLTEIRNFDTIEATKVAEANEKLYINRQDGFIGTGLKKDEFVCNCSDIDDIIIFYRDGKYKIIRVADKIFVGKNIIYLTVFKKNDSRTIYNVVYRDGRKGFYFIKRFNVTSVTRDREYDLTQGKEGSRVLYFTANPNGEAEVIKITFEPSVHKKKLFIDKDFSELLIKGKNAKGYLLTKYPVHRISLKSHGHSTLGGRKIWFDPDINRLNYDEHGQFLGEFHDDDQILVILKNGEFYLTNFDVSNHYENNILRIEKYQPDKVWTVVLYDADQQGYPYLKRFVVEASKRKQNFLGENANSQLLILTDTVYPLIKVVFGGNDAYREPIEIDAEQFIAVKGFKAKGKRISTWTIGSIEELEPQRFPEPEETEEGAEETEEAEITDEGDEPETSDSPETPSDIYQEEDGQLSLFPDEL